MRAHEHAISKIRKTRQTDSRSRDILACGSVSTIIDRNIAVTVEMETEEQKKKRLEEKDELVQKIVSDLKWQATVTEREERLNILRRLASKIDDTNKPSGKQIDAGWKMEKERTTDVNKTLFTARQMNEKNRTFYDETILTNENGRDEYEITSMISIRKIPEDRLTINKPISINFTLDGNRLMKNITFINQNVAVRLG